MSEDELAAPPGERHLTLAEVGEALTGGGDPEAALAHAVAHLCALCPTCFVELAALRDELSSLKPDDTSVELMAALLRQSAPMLGEALPPAEWQALADEYCGMDAGDREELWSEDSRVRQFSLGLALVERAKGLATTDRTAAKDAAELALSLAQRRREQAEPDIRRLVGLLSCDLAGSAAVALAEIHYLSLQVEIGRCHLLCAEALLECGSGDPLLLCDLLSARALGCWCQGDGSGALRWLARALKVATTVHDLRREALLRLREALVLEAEGRQSEALEARQKGHALAEALGTTFSARWPQGLGARPS